MSDEIYRIIVTRELSDDLERFKVSCARKESDAIDQSDLDLESINRKFEKGDFDFSGRSDRLSCFNPEPYTGRLAEHWVKILGCVKSCSGVKGVEMGVFDMCHRSPTGLLAQSAFIKEYICFELSLMPLCISHQHRIRTCVILAQSGLKTRVNTAQSWLNCSAEEFEKFVIGEVTFIAPRTNSLLGYEVAINNAVKGQLLKDLSDYELIALSQLVQRKEKKEKRKFIVTGLQNKASKGLQFVELCKFMPHASG